MQRVTHIQALHGIGTATVDWLSSIAQFRLESTYNISAANTAKSHAYYRGEERRGLQAKTSDMNVIDR